jgi:thiamine transport system permease protein
MFLTGMLGLLFFFFVAPLAALPLRSVTRLEAARGQRTSVQTGLTLDYYKELFINRRDSLFYVPPIDALRNSLTYAGMTVVLSLAMGFPAASALAKPGKLEKYIDPFLMLPLGASAVTLGLGYILAFNKPPLALLTWPWLVPLAHSTIALPFVIRNLQSTLGATPLRVWWTVDWPIVSRATLSAAAFAFTISLGEFGATSLLVRPEYPTLPTAIYRFLSQPGGLNYGQALAMASILMLVCGVGIGLIEAVRLPGTGEF